MTSNSTSAGKSRLLWPPRCEEMPRSRYAVRLMRLAFLSPRIQRDILAGTQPTSLRLEDLVRAPMPLSWKAQKFWVERDIRRLAFD